MSARSVPRGGFTVVELLVAMMVFAIGVLGLVATTATVTRMMGGATRQTLAAATAQSRLEKLRGVPCGSLAGGADTVRGIVSVWAVTPVTRGVNVTETVSFGTSSGRRSRVYMTTIPC